MTRTTLKKPFIWLFSALDPAGGSPAPFECRPGGGAGRLPSGAALPRTAGAGRGRTVPGDAPALVVAVALLQRLPSPLAMSLNQVDCCVGGTASNVVTLIARAEVALSVVITTLSAVKAVLLIPRSPVCWPAASWRRRLPGLANPGPAGPTPAGAPHHQHRGGHAELKPGRGAGLLRPCGLTLTALPGTISAVVHAVLAIVQTNCRRYLGRLGVRLGKKRRAGGG